jgi:hemerythrin-like metal-binding protein
MVTLVCCSLVPDSTPQRGYIKKIELWKMKKEITNWQSRYELGIEEIDLQHNFFFNLINRLKDELKQADNLDYQAALLSELYTYASFHFLSEENLMVREGYPDTMEHKNFHIGLLDQFSSRAHMVTTDSSGTVLIDFLEFLTDWIFHHINSVDRLFAEYMHEKEMEKSVIHS